jgi:hypothetical protein
MVWRFSHIFAAFKSNRFHDRDSTFVCIVNPSNILSGGLIEGFRPIPLSSSSLSRFAAVLGNLLSWGADPFLAGTEGVLC